MIDVHFWAMAGLIWFAVGMWALARASQKAIETAAERAELDRLLGVIREVKALREYGARAEAEDLAERLVRGEA